jgi:hypothetical protein
MRYKYWGFVRSLVWKEYHDYRSSPFTASLLVPIFVCNMRTSPCILAGLAAHLALAKDWESPVYSDLYQYEMPISPIKEPPRKFDFPNAPPIDYFEVEIKPFEQQIHPNSAKTRLVGYDGMWISRISHLASPSVADTFGCSGLWNGYCDCVNNLETLNDMLAIETLQKSPEHPSGQQGPLITLGDWFNRVCHWK